MDKLILKKAFEAEVCFKGEETEEECWERLANSIIDDEIDDDEDANFILERIVNLLKLLDSKNEWEFYIVKTGWSSIHYAILGINKTNCERKLCGINQTRLDIVKCFLG